MGYPAPCPNHVLPLPLRPAPPSALSCVSGCRCKEVEVDAHHDDHTSQVHVCVWGGWLYVCVCVCVCVCVKKKKRKPCVCVM